MRLPLISLLCPLVLLGACQSGDKESSPEIKSLGGGLEILEDDVEALVDMPEVKATPEEASYLLDNFDQLLDGPPEAEAPLDVSPASIAQRTLARYFQADTDVSRLSRAEVLETFSAMDSAGRRDGILTQIEFRTAYDERRTAIPGDELSAVQAMMRGKDPWMCLTQVLDLDQDGALSNVEFRAYFEALGQDELVF